MASIVIVACAWARHASGQLSEPFTDAAISRITVVRQGCFGGCPIYTLTLRRQGASTYIGRNAARLGIYAVNLLPAGAFERLTKSVEELHFFALADTSGAGVMDAEKIVVTVTTASRTKVVKTFDFAEAPSAFRGIVALADGVAANLAWENLNQPKDGIVAPFPLRKVDPQYTQEARNARLEGSVIVQVEVRPDGTVDPDRLSVVQGLGMGLDELAIDSVKQWSFKPAYRDGNPMGIQMAVNVPVEFRL